MKIMRDTNNAAQLECVGSRLRLTVILVLVLSHLTICSTARAGDLDRVVAFDIKAQTLEKALLQFGIQAHVQIVFASKSAMGQIRTGALIGKYTGRQALVELLKGSKFRYVEDGNTAEIVPAVLQPTEDRGHYSTRGDLKSGHGAARRSPNDPTSLPSSSDDKTLHKSPALQEVIVTGTHIKGVTPAYPIATITRMQILQSGLSTVDDVLRTSPLLYAGGENPGAVAAGATSSGSYTGAGIGTANLFGIGSEATLTLIDGHRAAGADLASPSSLDLSMIPVVAVQRIQVQTGGSSAIYGSDAVAGVVNVILRSGYSGEETTGYVGWTQHGGGFVQRYSQLSGLTSSRGSVLVAAEFNKEDPLRADQREISGAAGSNVFLEPRLKSESLILNTHYAVTTRLEAHALGLYTHRTAFDSFADDQGPSRVDEFETNAGLTYRLPDNRAFGVDVTDSGFAQISSGIAIPCQCNPTTQATQNGLFGIDMHGNGGVVDLPTGTLSAAFGAGYRRTQFAIEGNNGISLRGSRRVLDTYLEVNIPLVHDSGSRIGLEGLRLDGALRYSHYSDFGSTTNPVVGLIYTPFRRVTLKTTYGTSFRAPNLEELYDARTVELLPGVIFHGAPGGSDVIYEYGGNVGLGPETAHSFTTTMQFSSRPYDMPGNFGATATYFYIHFTNRIGNPIVNPIEALVSPLVAPFVVRNPTASQQNAAIAAAAATGGLSNPLGLPYIPSNVTAILEDEFTNLSADSIHGATSSLRYTWSSSPGDFSITWDGTWLRYDARLLSGAAPEQISGTLFNPPNFKMRLSIGWRRGGWNAVAFVNHVGAEQFSLGAPGAAPVEIGGWTTVDGQLGYAISRLGVIGASADVALSVLNIADAQPARVPSTAFIFAPFDFDTSNASAIGRTFALSVSVSW